MPPILENKAVLQSAATTGNGTEIQLGGAGREHVFYIAGSDATVTTGAVQIETAVETGYAGTWAAIGSATTVVRNTVLKVNYAGVLLAVRARISTNMTGGATVTVTTASN